MMLNTIEEIVADIKQGKMVILMDDEDRENEGDLIMPAELVSKEDINFMAKYGRGLICLTLTEKRCQQLNLPLMVRKNRDMHDTNFTISIEAAQGVTTGISASDRATTIKVAVAKNAKPSDIIMPGHVFPIMAQPGGVLTRSGHTEAGCDLTKLAGLEPAAVIVEILNEDGTMARMPDLQKFAKKHNLKIATIADLIKYRIESESTVEKIAETIIKSKFGKFNLTAFQEKIGGEIHLALSKGKINPNEDVVVRVHVLDTLKDLLLIVDNKNYHSLQQDLATISQQENSVMVILRNDKDSDILNNILFHGKEGHYKESDILLSYGVGAQILKDLGVRKMRVLGTPLKMSGLSGFGLEVTEYLDY